MTHSFFADDLLFCKANVDEVGKVINYKKTACLFPSSYTINIRG